MYNIGVDLGGTNLVVGLVNGDNEIVAKDKVKTEAGREAVEITRDMAKLAENVCAAAGIALGDINSVGIASPGTVDPQNAIIKYANNLKMDKYDIGGDFSSFTGISKEKIFTENDANAAAFGEHIAGAAKGHSSSVLITLGTGLGGGIILDGKIYAGFNHAGGELGHMVIKYGGRSCTCGRGGCWESYASATGLIRSTKEALLENPDNIMWEMIEHNIDNTNARTAWEAMRAGDTLGKKLVDDYIDYLACGITNIVNIFQPEIFSIGGGVSNEGDGLLLPLIDIVERDQYGNDTSAPRTKLKIAKLKNDAGIIGAANLYLNYIK